MELFKEAVPKLVRLAVLYNPANPGASREVKEDVPVAAQVLGLTPVQSFRRIVLPQAIRMTLPPLASNFVQLIKFSSLGAVISVSEITRRGMELSATNFRPLETFTFIAVVYFFICWPLAMGIRVWERRLASQ